MPPDEQERMMSDQYADILIEYGGDESIFEQFPDSAVKIINFLYAVVHIPVELFTLDFFEKWGYSIIPNCFGIISHSSIESTGIPRIRRISNYSLRGQGVLIGVIDTGIDYLNPVFQNADNTTRIVSIWDQTISSDKSPKNFEYGTEYTKEDINLALKSEQPFNIVPSMDENGHGTMVAGIAAGNEVPESNFYGIATDSELVVVKLKQAKSYLREFFLIPEGTVCYSEVDILFGLYYLLEAANELKRPLVICIAVGSSKGGHDGRGILCDVLSQIASRPGIGVVVAAGNEGNERRHYYGSIDQRRGSDAVEIMVGNNEKGMILELWGESPNIYSVDIISPSGEYVPRVPVSLSDVTEISFIFERTKIYLLNELVETQTGDQVFLFRFVEPSPGIWRINVFEKGDLNRGFHMWLPMDKFISDDTFFIDPDIYTTVLALGNTFVPITVTAYNDIDESLYLFASRGYTRTNAIKPDLAAPGVNVIGPAPGNGFVAYTGTSVAAAHTAGVTAMILEWANTSKAIPNISTIELKKLLLRGARRKTDVEYPNREWGYGILDIYNVFNALRTEFFQ
ncbi:S8 family peptidase [Anaerosacchariphilus polymeriproducens]|uniref:Peptidase S8/S53 domain-containing protein n=1 Tax=Anaerosacchariphilus polymeriproducens TaxID=1812858 RepID=A0A371AQU2_9FIRM|nr:S8 family peptidase [Anaerosacchariphilus polymeriproducens]RDU21953.1 hypothetical protein DWV06_15560 [Anaerosacchariphilus polymeriproducens]